MFNYVSNFFRSALYMWYWMLFVILVCWLSALFLSSAFAYEFSPVSVAF